MNLKRTISILSLSISSYALADQSYYCPQNHGYINIGMSVDQVIAACGNPMHQTASDQPVYAQIPVQQLIYNNIGGRSSFYGVWNLNTGFSGTNLQVDVIDNKVKAISFNGSRDNASSVCNGVNIQAGDPVGKVYNACGTPAVINNTYTRVPIPSQQKPLIWIYQATPYQPSITLTFVNGKLQSINN